MFQRKNSGFTLVEIMLAMAVFAMIMTSVLLSVENISITRIKTENRVALLEDLYFFSEKLVADIKEGGTLDYEEYWNRQSFGNQVITGNITTTTGVGGGYYSGATGVGNYGLGGDLATNYGSGLYSCVSKNGTRIGTGSGCLTDFNTGATSPNQNLSGTYQRYGQYHEQFWDYNSNTDADGGDEDGSGSINDDEDDSDLGNGPIVLSGAMPELYLVSPYDKTRVFFRYIVYKDPGTSSPCTISSTGALSDGCMGNVQILKMRGMDLGYDHAGTVGIGNSGVFDGKIDTWFLHNDWPNGVGIVAGKLATGKDNEWVDIFPNSINVKSLKFTAFPQKDPWLSWSAADCSSSEPNCISPFIHPYVRLEMTLGFSWGKRRALKNDDPTISINTTVSLGDRE